ncbi:PREDICTED: J domain-containing protein required for chloroplast accumulation response 1 isoform X2 [Ipomoea nil]|uniref:J domain-containing protein required for chloroplast accumulation response 1 isoform X2 n=1 Tax=Ipomoea nil TaxID=35883 RepID=UPI000901B07B|nr:PREDICTED: J domain-containing protein required for chloroplast accumulation response 1 isoform X2 [Ipomoea nil]
MERLLQGSFETTRADNMDMDFNDVFGGPPRRFSIQEVRKRNSFNDQMESEEDSEAVPVFGADRRCSQQGNEFYDDIFGGDEAYSSPRRMEMEAYGSRVLSPAWPLPPKAEPFSTSLPAQFSLPAKVTKATEYPTFGSGNRSPYHNSKDGGSNGSLSRFSSQSRQRENGSQMIFRQRSLSREASLSGDERSSGEKDSEEAQFHFSIYKWAGKGVPLLIPLMRGKNSNKPKENNSRLERCLSSNARVQCDEPDGKLNVSIASKKQEKRNENDYKEPDFVATEAVPELKNLNNAKNKVVPEGPKSGSKLEGEEETRSKIKAEFRNGIQNEGLRKKETESKPQSMLPHDVHQGQGSLFAGNGETNQVAREKNARADDSNARFNETMKKREVEAKMNGKKSGITKNRVEVQDMPSNPEEKSTKVGVKGKVQEFVKIFNKQEATPVSKGETRSQSSRWRGGNFNAVEKETGDSTRQTNEEVQIPSMNKTAADAFQRVEQILNTKEKTNKHSYKKPSIHQTTTHPADQNNASSFSEPIRNGLRRSVGSADDLFHGSFVVEELYEDESKPLQKSGESHDMKASDAKIQQWSQGRKGNIRSLLSTLQLVLWPESGWKPVPLVDLIEGNAVKRAYQKALLYLHPDKLQQKGAASHQKYIAEKVFAILQEAWDHFNSLGGI